MQEEGGAHWGISKGEIEDLLDSGTPLPKHIEKVVEDR